MPNFSQENTIISDSGCWRCDFNPETKVVEYCVFCQGKMAEGVSEKIRSDAEYKALLIRALGGPKAYHNFTFGNLSEHDGNREAVEAGMIFNPEKQNLFIWGPTGTGKTHLATAIARVGAEIGASVLVLNPAQLMRSCRGIDSSDEEAVIENISRTSVFVLDDLGVGRATEFALQILYEIINKRDMNYKNGLIITSNLSLKELAEKMNDDRLASRIAGLCKIVKIEGDDNRLKGGRNG